MPLRLIGPLMLGVLVTACAPYASDGSNSANDQMRGWESPGNVLDDWTDRLDDLISQADVGQTFGTDDDHVPYPDTYWPFYRPSENADNGIDSHWHGPDDASPLEKYLQATGASGDEMAQAKRWENVNHGAAFTYVDADGNTHGVEAWMGHCPGWTAAAMSSMPILHPVFAQPDGQGGVVPCEEGSDGCIRFEIGDINGLAAEGYLNEGPVLGDRCDTPNSDIERDEYGRVVRVGGCQGLNAGAMLMFAANRMKRHQLPFAIDAQTASTTDEIWNQPAYRYTVNAFWPLTESEAANLVATNDTVGELSKYQWNESAAGWLLVDFTIHWVSEKLPDWSRAGPNTEVLSGLETTQDLHLVTVIELDRPFGEEGARIIGGEYLDHGDQRLTVAPFVWINDGMAPEWVPYDDDWHHHNPYVRPSVVKTLMDMGR